MNTGVHMSLSNLVSSVCMPRSGIAGSYGTLNSQSNLEKEEWELEESTCLTSGSTTKPQSSRQYGTGTKTEIQINGTEEKAQR